MLKVAEVKVTLSLVLSPKLAFFPLHKKYNIFELK